MAPVGPRVGDPERMVRNQSANPFKLYNNFNYIGVRSFILNGAPFRYKTGKNPPFLRLKRLRGCAAVRFSIRSAVKAASRWSRSRTARALTVHRWSGSGLPCDHGHTSCRARATRRYAANDGARKVDFECFLGSSGTRPLHTVPLQCHSKQCVNRHLRPPTARSDTVAFILPS